MKIKNTKPPLIARWLLSFFLNHSHPQTILADMEEIYHDIAKSKNVLLAKFWYWFQIIIIIPSFVNNSIYWSVTMFKNYVTIAFRTILKNKGYSFINIAGLAIGMACTILILLWILDELSYDRFHKDSKNIYQVLTHGKYKNNPSTPVPLAPALKEEFPEIIYSTRYNHNPEKLLIYKNKKFYENGIVNIGPAFFKLFTFPFVKGDPNTALDDINSIVISEAIAEKYFADENPVGKVLTMNNARELAVTGVLKNVLHNSSLQFDIAIPYEIKELEIKRKMVELSGGGELNWDMSWRYYSPKTYIRLQVNTSADDMNYKIADIIQRHKKEEDVVISIMPFTQRNLFFSDKMKYIYIFSAIALFILLIACINFVNLSTARATNRAKEIGIRKVTGAFRKNIIVQFLGESLIMSFTALLFALLIVILTIPVFNAVTGVELSLDILSNRFIFLALAGLILFIGIAAGSYPALFLSAFQPVNVLKGKLTSGSKSSLLRKTLVVIQFSLSIFLLASTGIVYKQLNFIKNKDIGYDKEHIVNIPMKGGSKQFYNVLKNRMIADERILGVTGTSARLPYFYWSTPAIDWDGKDPENEIDANFNRVDYNFIETLQIEISEGRQFSKQFPSDAKSGYIINEKMAEIMGLESTVGARFAFWDNPGKIIGVMKNFHFQPLNSKIEPLVLMLEPEKVSFMLVRIRPENISSSLQFIQETWEETVRTYPFEYKFLDEEFDSRYRTMEKMMNLSNSFTIIAVFIACLGLLGLASFTAEQRSKEIGVRKVLGASVPSIMSLLSREFTTLVLVANIIAWPLAWFVMNMWLQSFAYKTQIRLSVFLVSGALALIIALITVSYQSLKAAMMNPVDTLKYE